MRLKVFSREKWNIVFLRENKVRVWKKDKYLTWFHGIFGKKGKKKINSYSATGENKIISFLVNHTL